MPFTESNYENAVLQLFTQTLGYSYAYGPDIERDYHSPLYEDCLLYTSRYWHNRYTDRIDTRLRSGVFFC